MLNYRNQSMHYKVNGTGLHTCRCNDGTHEVNSGRVGDLSVILCVMQFSGSWMDED